MHQCLNIVEVQQIIFKHVYNQPEGCTTVGRLAYTCRAFNNTALDVLWEKLYSFVSLISALPRDLWKINFSSNKLILQRPMSLKDWKIFFRYSSRIRSLSYGSVVFQPESIFLGDDVIFALSAPPSYGPLIPHLKTLSLGAPNRQHALLLRLLLSPSLDSISFTADSLRSPEASILSSIGTICPSLKCLSITPDYILDTNGGNILSEALLHLQSLETLTCPALNEVTIIHLSHLSSLINLSFKLQLSFQVEKVQSYLAPPAFASIQSLAVQASTLSALTSLLESMDFKPRGVSFVVLDTPTLDMLHLFFLALVGSCDPKQLSSISLSTSNEGMLDAQCLTLSTFRPLFAVPNINSFELDLRCNISLDDDAINTLVNQWPKLTMLSINRKSGWGITSRITAKGLVRLLFGCPELADIALSVDFSDIDEPRVPFSRPGNGMTNDKCHVASFVTSKIDYPITVAAFLSDICPRLVRVVSSWSEELGEQELDWDEVDTYRERWEEVNRLLPAFRAVKKQCMA